MCRHFRFGFFIGNEYVSVDTSTMDVLARPRSRVTDTSPARSTCSCAGSGGAGRRRSACRTKARRGMAAVVPRTRSSDRLTTPPLSTRVAAVSGAVGGDQLGAWMVVAHAVPGRQPRSVTPAPISTKHQTPLPVPTTGRPDRWPPRARRRRSALSRRPRYPDRRLACSSTGPGQRLWGGIAHRSVPKHRQHGAML